MEALLLSTATFALGFFFGWLLHRERVERALYEDVVRARDRATATLAETSARLELANEDLVRLRGQLTDAQHLLDERDAMIAELEDELADVAPQDGAAVPAAEAPAADEPIDGTADAATTPEDVRLFDDIDFDDDADITEELVFPPAIGVATGEPPARGPRGTADGAPSLTANDGAADADPRADVEPVVVEAVGDVSAGVEPVVVEPVGDVSVDVEPVGDVSAGVEPVVVEAVGDVSAGVEPVVVEAVGDVSAGVEPVVVEPVGDVSVDVGPADHVDDARPLVETTSEPAAAIGEPLVLGADAHGGADPAAGSPSIATGWSGLATPATGPDEAAGSAAQLPSSDQRVGDTGAPDAEPDDLQRINGVGPALERLLIAEGITTYRQLALLDDQAVAELEGRTPRLAARMRRGGWIPQARRLHVETHGHQP